jgi:hypothetical protein
MVTLDSTFLKLEAAFFGKVIWFRKYEYTAKFTLKLTPLPKKRKLFKAETEIRKQEFIVKMSARIVIVFFQPPFCFRTFLPGIYLMYPVTDGKELNVIVDTVWVEYLKRKIKEAEHENVCLCSMDLIINMWTHAVKLCFI